MNETAKLVENDVFLTNTSPPSCIEEDPPLEEMEALKSEFSSILEDYEKLSARDEDSKAYHRLFHDIYWVYRKEVSRTSKRYSQEEIVELAKAKDNGDISARNALAESFLFGVMAIANSFNSYKFLDIRDLTSCGNLGLIYAANNYDYRKGYCFSTYATWWVFHYMTREATGVGRNIHLPEVPKHRFFKICKEEMKFYKNNQRYPTISELSKITGIPFSEIKILKNTAVTISLSTPVLSTEDEENTFDELQEFIPDYECNIETIIEEIDLHESLMKSFKQILKNPITIQVICKRYGIGCDGPLTFDVISKEMGLSRQRVQQIESKALVRLKNSKAFEKLMLHYY